jgi:uroporphyrin-3 C-methyltransferase
MQQRFYQNQDWALLKARYYLELAQINVHWSDSIVSVIALLEQADHLLQQFNDPKILDIRQAIAKDIAQIQALPRVDIAGILSQLDAAQNSINTLTIPLPASSPPAPENAPASPSKESTWRLHLQSSANILEKFVVIRRHDQNVQPLLPPLLESILKENLHLSLQEAQWAVLNNNPAVYQLVLKQAIQNLKMNFNENIAATAALIKKLIELEQINIMQKKQAIGAALPILNELIDAKKTQLNQPISTNQGGNQ